MIKFLKIFLPIFIFFLLVNQVNAQTQLPKTNEELVSSIEVKANYGGTFHDLIPGSTILYEDAGKTYIDSAGTEIVFDDASPKSTTYSISVFLNSSALGSIPGIGTEYPTIKIYFNCSASLEYKSATSKVLNAGQLNVEFVDAFGNLDNCVKDIFQEGWINDNLGGNINISVSLVDKNNLEHKALGVAKQFNFAIQPKALMTECDISFSGLEQDCSQYDPTTGKCIDLGANVNSNITVNVDNINSQGYKAVIYQNDTILDGGTCDALIKKNCNYKGISEPEYSLNIGPLEPDVYEFAIRYNPEWKSSLLQINSDNDLYLCRRTLTVVGFGEELVPPGENVTGDDLVSLEIEVAATIPLCDSIDDPDMKAKCEACQGSTDIVSGVWTGLGCMPTNFSGIVNSVFTLFSGLMGGFVFLCLVSNGLKIMAARGNPEALKKAQEAITACLVGFVVLVLSVLFLKIVGVDILAIPGWS